MSKLDDLILEALSEQERDIMKNTEELGWFALGRGQFTGKLGWVSWVIMITQGIMFVIGVWCAWHFYNAADFFDGMKWGLSAVVLILMAGQMKLSFMPAMQADRVLREIKRVELLILHNKT